MDFEQELQKIAKQYREEGYEIVLRPRGESVPPFAAGYELDLIAKRGNESVIVAVVPNRLKLAEDPNLVRLAEVTNAQPGWRFDLVILAPVSPLERVAHESREPSPEQVARMLTRAEQAAAGGDMESACVYAWAALEAAMRRTAADLGLNGKPTPTELLSTLYSNGPFSKDEFTTLRASYDLRTQVVHGFVPTKIDPALVHSVIAAAKKLLADQHQPVAG